MLSTFFINPQPICQAGILSKFVFEISCRLDHLNKFLVKFKALGYSIAVKRIVILC